MTEADRAQLLEQVMRERDNALAMVAQLREALLAAVDAINEGEGWHDENADDDGDDTCETSEPCGCKLPTLVNAALARSPRE